MYTLEEIVRAKTVLAEIEAFEIYSRLQELREKTKSEPARYYSGQQVAELFDINRKTLRSWRDSCGLEASPHSRHKYDLRAVKRWFQVHKATRWKKMTEEKKEAIQKLIDRNTID